MDSDPCIETFDTSAALAVLDGIVHRGDAMTLQTAGSAWEAAWIACLTGSSAWRSTAEEEFSQVVVELQGLLWTVDRRKVRSAPLGGRAPLRACERLPHPMAIVADPPSLSTTALEASL